MPRNAIDVLIDVFTFKEDFVEFIAIKLRECYQSWFRKKPRGYINRLSVDGTLLGAVKEVSLTYILHPTSFSVLLLF